MALARIKRPKKIFRVFEAGAGQYPFGLFRQANRAAKRGLKKRKFLGADTKPIQSQQVLQHMKIPTPKNLKLLQQCAVETVKSLRQNSQHIIFASYLMNVLAYQRFGEETLESAFIKAAVKALRPGGRMVFVQDKSSKRRFEQIAKKIGFGFHSMEIPEQKAKRSLSRAIRLRSTPEKREKQMTKYMVDCGLHAIDVFEKIANGEITDFEEFSKPTIIILRKPRNGEKIEK